MQCTRFSRAWLAAIILTAACPGAAHAAALLERTAKDTLTAVELDPGDTLRFKLRNGQVRTLVLEHTAAAILERVVPGGVVYHFTCRVRIDGHAMDMERYACTQECFYEPYVVNGLRIWFDSVADTFQQIPIRYHKPGNLDAHPHKQARLAVQDATLSICPEEMQPWLPRKEDRIDVGDCYNGDDCWMGPYLGKACHIGLDINHAKGEPLWTPIAFDDQWYFNSLKAGHNNNRWRGLRRWSNGDLWALQSHHLIDALVPEHTPLRPGTKYATTAGTAVGSHQHTHFEFKVVESFDEQKGPVDFDSTSAGPQVVVHLDPWIVLRQIFEDGKRRRGELTAQMNPLSPGRTGVSIQFSARIDQRASFDKPGSRRGTAGSPSSADSQPDSAAVVPQTAHTAGQASSATHRSSDRRHIWTFGDGGWATGPTVSHAFAKPGMYPVTLVVEEGPRRTTRTQHLTIDGPPVESPCLVLSASDEPAFRIRPLRAMDVYGDPPRFVPHTLTFTAPPGQPGPAARTVELKNLGGGRLSRTGKPQIDYVRGKDWLAIQPQGEGNRQSLRVSVNPRGLTPGDYAAIVHVACDGAMNPTQGFRVLLRVPDKVPSPAVIVDDRDPGFYTAPYFWVGHRFCNCKRKGFNGFYLTNGGRAAEGQFARFTPNLRAGTYHVAFRPETPFSPDARFQVRVRHKSGEQAVWVRPSETLTIGTFPFAEGTDGFVEIHAAGATGLVIADAVEFTAE